MPLITCPLCAADGVSIFFKDQKREYLRCNICALVFVPPYYFLSATDEKNQYDLHENSEADEGYRRFLNRAAEPLLSRLKPASVGLDFGCGPAPVLANILRDEGYEVSLYDHFYAQHESVWLHSYDFITATEVIEHLHQPGRELARLWNTLRPGGYLVLMTKLVIDAEAFSRWHYKNDPTHVCFFFPHDIFMVGEAARHPSRIYWQRRDFFAKSVLLTLFNACANSAPLSEVDGRYFIKLAIAGADAAFRVKVYSTDRYWQLGRLSLLVQYAAVYPL